MAIANASVSARPRSYVSFAATAVLSPRTQPRAFRVTKRLHPQRRDSRKGPDDTYRHSLPRSRSGRGVIANRLCGHNGLTHNHLHPIMANDRPANYGFYRSRKLKVGNDLNTTCLKLPVTFAGDIQASDVTAWASGVTAGAFFRNASARCIFKHKACASHRGRALA